MSEPITEETRLLLQKNPPPSMAFCDWDNAKLEQDVDSDNTLCVFGFARVTINMKVYTYRDLEHDQWIVDGEHGEIC